MATTTREMVHHFGDADSADFSVHLSSGSIDHGFDAEGNVATTKPTTLNRFSMFMVPLAVFGALAAPVSPRGRRIRTLSGTTVTRPWLDAVWEDEWRWAPEFISERQVEALNALLALPFAPDLDVDLREHD